LQGSKKPMSNPMDDEALNGAPGAIKNQKLGIESRR
jgi:hypothetical protein